MTVIEHQSIQPAFATEIALAEHAAVIRALGKRVIGDIVEIGKRLTLVKDGDRQRGIPPIGHGYWLPWLKNEFGWQEQTARNFMQVHEMALKSPNFGDLSLPVSGLYALAAPSTPDEAREAVIERAQNGEALSLKEVQRMIEEAKQKQDEDYERRVKALTEKYQREAEQLRRDIGDALSPDDLQTAIDDALGPLQQKIKLLEEEREKRNRAAPKRPDPYGLPATSIIAALHQLALALTITPTQVLERQKMVADATGQKLEAVTAEVFRDAKTALPWLQTFIEEEAK